MPKAIITSDEFSGLPEVLQKEYNEGTDGFAGKYILNVTPAEGFTLENTTALKKALQAERTQRESVTKALKAFEGLDASEARKAVEKLQEIGDPANLEGDLQKKLEVAQQQIAQKFEKEKAQIIGKLEGDLKALSQDHQSTLAQLQEQMIRNKALQAISANKGRAPLLLPVIERSVRMVKGDDGRYRDEVVGDDGNARLTTKSGSMAPMTIEEFVSELRDSDDYAPAFEGTGAKGSGAESSQSRSGGSTIRLSSTDARNPAKYRQAKELAEKQGVQMQIVD